MHLYWIGVAARLWRRGDHSANWILEEVARGRILRPAGHGEPGNDLGLPGSSVGAERCPAAPTASPGARSSPSLSPVWDWPGIHGLDATDPASPEGRPRLHPPRRPGLPHRRDLGRARRAGHRQQRHGPRRRRGRSGSRLPRAAGRAPRTMPSRTASPGAAVPADSRGLLRHRAAGLRSCGGGREGSGLARAGGQDLCPLTCPLSLRWRRRRSSSIPPWALLERVAVEWDARHRSRSGMAGAAARGQAACGGQGARRVVDLATKVAGAASLFKRHELERLHLATSARGRSIRRTPDRDARHHRQDLSRRRLPWLARRREFTRWPRSCGRGHPATAGGRRLHHPPAGHGSRRPCPRRASAACHREGSDPMSKRLIFNGFSMNVVSHIFHGMWRHPQSRQSEFNDLDTWIGLGRSCSSAGTLRQPSSSPTCSASTRPSRGSWDTYVTEAVQIPINELRRRCVGALIHATEQDRPHLHQLDPAGPSVQLRAPGVDPRPSQQGPDRLEHRHQRQPQRGAEFRLRPHRAPRRALPLGRGLCRRRLQALGRLLGRGRRSRRQGGPTSMPTPTGSTASIIAASATRCSDRI